VHFTNSYCSFTPNSGRFVTIRSCWTCGILGS